MKKHHLLATLVIFVSFFLNSPKASALGLGDLISNRDKIMSAVKVTKSIVKAQQDISPHEEYQIGRSVAAQILAQHNIIEDESLLHKVNLIGQSLVLHSKRPSIFNGYSFSILDAEDPNGFATPGGHIFITKGMLDLCETDHHIAAILSHEIGHVAAAHGKGIIKKMRWTNTTLTAGQEIAKHSESTSNIANDFGDIAKSLFSKVAEKGFGRRQELEADGFGVLNLKAAGFTPNAVVEMLEKINQKFGMMDIPLFKSHPRPELRIQHVKRVLESGDPTFGLQERPSEDISQTNSSSKTQETPKKKKRFGLWGK